MKTRLPRRTVPVTTAKPRGCSTPGKTGRQTARPYEAQGNELPRSTRGADESKVEHRSCHNSDELEHMLRVRRAVEGA